MTTAKKYINSEAAVRILQKEAASHYPTAYHVGLLAAARMIDSIPAADVRPVVGGWLHDGFGGGDMSEVDALLEIASAIRTLAISVSGIGTVLWLFLFFKKMG